jgi:26S proteasome regulatory subunit N1
MVETRNGKGKQKAPQEPEELKPVSKKVVTATKAEEKPEESNKPKDKKAADEPDELSEEDQQLKDELEMLVTRLSEKDSTLYKAALESMRTLIRSSTTSMTSVPKPLKFLRPHYEALCALHEQWPASEVKASFCITHSSYLLCRNSWLMCYQCWE